MKKIIFVITFAILLLIPKSYAKAFQMDSYLTIATDVEFHGHYGTGTLGNGTATYATYKNTSIDNSRYVIYRNSVISGKEKYDLVLYPWAIVNPATPEFISSYPGLCTFYYGNTSLAGYKMIITEHTNTGIGKPITWSGYLGFGDLDNTEYVILPNRIDRNDARSHVGVWIAESYVSGYGWKYCGTRTCEASRVQSYDYGSVFHKVTIPETGYVIYYGSDGQWTADLSFDSLKAYIEENWPSYSVNYVDVLDSSDGMQLGKIQDKSFQNDTIRGFDIGSDVSPNAYYNGYYLYSDTSATVTGNGITVYRIFKECLFDISGNIYWRDNNDKLDMRPEEAVIQIYQDEKLYDEIIIDSFSDNSYSFANLPKYSKEDGHEYVYALEEIIYSKYNSNGELKDAYVVQANMPENYDFTNILKFPLAEGIDMITKHHTNIVIKTNIEEKVPVKLKAFEMFVDEEFNETYGILTDKEFNVFADNLGEMIKNIPVGKYEISVDSNYSLNDITISESENVKLEKENGIYYLVVLNSSKDESAILNIQLSNKQHRYQFYMKKCNYFAVK